MDSLPRPNSASPTRTTVTLGPARAAIVVASPLGSGGDDAELLPFLGGVHPADGEILRELSWRYPKPVLIGGGGLARVYRGRDAHRGRWVALKVPRLGAREPAGRRRFLREARMARAARGDHVVRLLGAPRVLGERVLVLELFGDPLLARLADGALDLVLALRYARHAAAGLASAHRAGIVHGDVNPANILLTANGATAKLADFGLARRRASGHGRQRLAGFAGTLAYSAPEVFLGEAADFPADVYSLGCVLYHAIAGEPPFGGDTFGDYEIGHVVHPPQPLRSRVPGIPAALDALVLGCLAKDPAARPADARVLDRALAIFR